jgi:WD40 repeat protein
MSCASLKPGQANFVLEHRNKIKFISSFPPENRIAVLSDDGVITVWDITNGQVVREINPDRSEKAIFMVYSRYGIVVRYQRSNVLAFFPVTEGLVQSTTLGKSMGNNTVRNIAGSPDGKYVVYDVIDYDSTSDTDRDSDWDLKKGTTRTKETTIANSRYSGKLHCVDTENNKWLFEIRLPYSSETAVSTKIEHDYGDLGSNSYTNSVSYGDIISVTCIAIDPQFKIIACGFSDGSIRIYDPYKKSEIKQERFQAHKQAVTTLTFGPQGAYLLSGDGRGFLHQWKKNSDSSEWKRAGTIRMGSRLVSINISPNGRMLIIKDGSKAFRIIDFISGREIKTIKGGSLIDSVLFKSDNQIAALGIKGDSVFVWNLGTL